MTSLKNMLRYAKSGVASKDMTSFDKLLALQLAGDGFPVNTLTGVPPISFQSDGTPLIPWSMKGNGQQNGTPTPEFVGVRTANLYDNNLPYIVRCYYSSDTNTFTPNQNNSFVAVSIEAGKRYFVNGAKRYSPSTTVRWCTSSAAPASGVSVVRTGTFSQSDTFVLDANSSENYLSIFLCGDSDYNGYGTVENAISTNGEALVVDNGYKIPITCADTTVTVYTGDPLRKALDGSDAVDTLSSDGTIIRTVDADGNALSEPVTQTVVIPTIPTANGINILSIDTTLQPSEMTITGHIKAI